jgi:hypothetical protein
MLPVSYYNPAEFSSPKLAYAFAKGCGGTITDEDDLFPGPVALFGSPARWPLLRRAQAEGREWYYIDHAYFSRGKYFRITKNAYQHDGVGTSTGERFHAFQRLSRLQPWHTDGSHVLICPNSDVYFGLHGIDPVAWLREVMTTLRQHTDRPIRVRWKVQRAERPIHEDLEGAWAVVVFSSAAALDGLIAGVPCFTLAPFAASVRMGLSDLRQIEAPLYPDGRETFLSVLADHQWTLQEILKGVAWRSLCEVYAHAA